MADKTFYKSISPLGEHTKIFFVKIESDLVYIKNQIEEFNIDREKFLKREKSRFDSDLEKVRGRNSRVPSEFEALEFSKHVKDINQFLVGKGVHYEMVVTNSLNKLFFG